MIVLVSLLPDGNYQKIISVCLLVMASILFPDSAFAWGGGIHLQLGTEVLANLSTLPNEMAALLKLHPKDFLYGCLAPDITLGKKYTHHLLHCHRWGIGRTLLKEAGTDHQKACAYGYLCHLAADTVAHNYFVPYKIIRSFPAITMKHTYWEMRFETFVSRDTWKLASVVCRADRRANDVLLRNVLSSTLFSFGTNKRIFNSIMVLSRMEKIQKVVQTLSNKSRYQLAEADREEYMELARGAMLEFLGDPDNSRFLRVDPTGEKALAAADILRKSLRLRYKSGLMSKLEGFEEVKGIRSTLRGSLHNPELLKRLHV
ncbi:MAG: zinc dependent phospholipase C family protein [Desulfuromonadaceae bacterium]|nr:zinc dependent phospholipase C family protein [Desulfuromonadaceae bacterium]MDD2854052.1 zinc dependent phospholipase C family protein [Desulfuromonadaceae bacterium]